MAPRVPVEDRKLITRLFLEGLPQRVICQRTGRLKTAVRRIIRAFRDEGRIAGAQRPGRPKITQHVEDELIVAAVVADPFLNASEIRDELPLEVSTSAIRRRFKEAGLSNCVAAKKPFLTGRQCQQRLQFAQEHQHWSQEEWGTVVFSDESTFCTRCRDQQWRVCRPLNSR
ncbi:hypothetical protein HPB48_005538 [Haemaphysalis longicornis]|uniref:Transposase Tc1-like domain-containing protein n=1 Tax=Haemaphysalis longicornis TaxID=44386 RepID=A0A9J6H411_HAELO|nr:hypothetical protein HPB48_005538 [Haemaphysalis longicornis]